ncbi:hypothetical protein [Methylococcus capsulatus]|uniref:Uncharacterized protein n=1 Tax=Methylococcus capsulatus TaxID=414 RepID=A0AA35V6V1_METCP|nr:hypothetical protein [Methylococcus capsulatus]CAI8841164.1 conserved protein of unknown function [Methylococcus capsulatus]
MSDELISKLNDAIKTGEILSVIYHGGSQPGSVRQLSPIKVTSREVRGIDISSNEVKTFLVAKMELANSTSSPKQYDPSTKSGSLEPATIREAYQGQVEKLKELGWYVGLEKDAISLHRYFKNGKIRKGADVVIAKYDDNPSRPFYVYGPSLASARTFGKLSSAMELFNEESKTHAPNNKT